MSLVLLMALWVGPGSQDAVFRDVQALTDDRRFGAAWSRLAGIEDPVMAARAEADLAFFARDFRASLAAVDRGLAHERGEGNLYLLYRGTSAALWIRDEDAAVDLAWQLDQAIRRAELDPTERGWWEQAGRELVAGAEALRAGNREREARLSRAKSVAAGVLGGAFLGMFLLGRRAQG